MLGGLPANTIDQYARDGRLPSTWIGKHRRFTVQRSRTPSVVRQDEEADCERR